ncbi:MAG: hypothetical protein ACJARP_003157 [Vicingaceae bacterium]|jgi:hypothetical protein
MRRDETIYESLNAPVVSLTPTHKAYISGCLMEHVIDNSEAILSSHDFEFLMEHDRKDWDAKFLRYDTAAQLRNKLNPDRLGAKHRLIYPIQELIEKVLDCYKVHYSITDHGKIYKVAICISETQSWNIEVESEYSFENISISTYPTDYRKNYMHSATPSIILDLILSFEKENELGSGQLRLKQLIEKILESNLQIA